MSGSAYIGAYVLSVNSPLSTVCTQTVGSYTITIYRRLSSRLASNFAKPWRVHSNKLLCQVYQRRHLLLTSVSVPILCRLFGILCFMIWVSGGIIYGVLSHISSSVDGRGDWGVEVW